MGMGSITLAPVNILHIIYASIAVFGIFVVAGKKEYKALALLLAVHALQESLDIFEDQNITRQYWLVTPALQLAFGSLYYLFAKNLIYGDLRLRRHLLHLLPAAVAILFTKWWPALLALAFFILLVYLVLTFRLIGRYHIAISELTADDDRHKLNWLRNTLIVDFLHRGC